MIEEIKWLLLSMLLSLSEGSVCTNSGNCSCLDVDYWRGEIRCPSESDPKFFARFDALAENCKLECQEAASWSEFGYQSTFELIRHWKTLLTIERCPLPDESFNHISRRFGMEPAEHLIFTSHMNLSSTLTRQHLSESYRIFRLGLPSNGLTELPSDLFREVGGLEQLDLSKNEIAMLPRDIFQGLPKLWEVDLSYNVIEFIDWRLFDNCTNLRRLLLRENLIASLDHRSFRNMNQPYQEIDLAENYLETLPLDAFNYTKKLTLDISGNRFSTLPEELFFQTNLTELTLSHNRGNLKTLPMNFLNNLTRLEKVILIRNNFTYLPENIFWASFSVKSIDLHGNALTTLPENIFRDSTALVSLNLSENSLHYLPERLFSAVSNLRELNLARNYLVSLSENIFGDLDSLLDLNLESNNITSMHPKTFHKLQKIRTIRLSHNSLNLTDPSFLILEKYFHGSTILNIFLDHNNLSGELITMRAEYEIPANLHLVDLTYNQISKVSVRNPAMGSHDVEYDLRHNNVRSIEIFDVNSSKMSILVDDNPLDCGCTIYDPLKYLHSITDPLSDNNLKIIFGNASCNEPYEMLGTPVASLILETFTCLPKDDRCNVQCTEGCGCLWRPHDKTRIVDCSSRNLSEMPDKVVKFVSPSDSGRSCTYFSFERWPSTLVILDLKNNSLTEIPTLNGSGYEHVESLVLSHNNISRLSFDVLPPKLQILRLDHNELRTLNATTVETIMNSTTLREVDLEENPWNCDAETRNGLATLREKFGKNVHYSFDMRTCLDSRRATSSGETNISYISFVRF